MTIRVMLADDSSIVRKLMREALIADKDIEVVAEAFNGTGAIAMARQHRPDIIILDIEMPEMDGLTALPKLLGASPGAKIIMASTLTLHNAGTSLKALELGATDYVAKPTVHGPEELQTFHRELREKMHALTGRKLTASPAAASARVVKMPLQSARSIRLASPDAPLAAPVEALAIASSTGGPQALLTLFGGLKDQLKHIPILITQHMPPAFTTILAANLSKAAGRPCREGREGEIVQPGQTYVAPGNFHMVAEKRGEEVILHVNQEPPENFCRPAADPMLRSLSLAYGPGLLVVVLTGMGSDGLEGAKAVVKGGGCVIAQDEATSVVWGMPRAVAEQGLCRAVLPLAEIAPYLTRIVSHARK